MDIIRIRQNNSFRYINKYSKKKVNKKNLKRIKSLKIPPAYNKVKISSCSDDKLQATGIDSKNRKQYIYHPDHYEESRELKFNDLIIFGKKIKRIRHDINELLQKHERIPSKNVVIALILYLIDKCNFRVGNEKYKKLYNSFGVTTLNKNHLDFKNNCIKIEFIGKKGVINKGNINNKNCIRLIENLCNIYNNEYLFCYQGSDGSIYRITEKHINNFLKDYHKDIYVKMFRTWNANYILLKEILNYNIPKDSKEANKNVLSAIKKAAELMHHSKNVSKKSYMSNEIIDLYLNHTQHFYQLLLNSRKSNDKLPTINRLLTIFLSALKK